MTDTPEIELPPVDLEWPVHTGPTGIEPQPEDGPQPGQDPLFEESEPINPDTAVVDPAVGQRVTARVGAVTSWTATKALNTARGHLGFREGRNNDNPFWKWPPYYTWLRNAAYCASAQSYCAWTGGAKTGLAAIGGGHYNCAEWVTWGKRNSRFHSYSTTPQRGDLVMFAWDGRHSYAEHVGILESYTPGYVTCIEFNTLSGSGGNQSDGGGCYRRTRSTRWVVGYVRPRYGGEINVKPISRPVTGKIVLTVDGAWGPNTTKRLQQFMGIAVDGELGPNTRKALQRLVGVKQDGEWGPATKKALQRLVRVPQDGDWGPITIKAFQRYLNAQGLRRAVALGESDGPDINPPAPNAEPPASGGFVAWLRALWLRLTAFGRAE
jgi:hypothetical protein